MLGGIAFFMFLAVGAFLAGTAGGQSEIGRWWAQTAFAATLSM
jgi:hypothetical protein